MMAFSKQRLEEPDIKGSLDNVTILGMSSCLVVFDLVLQFLNPQIFDGGLLILGKRSTIF